MTILRKFKYFSPPDVVNEAFLLLLSVINLIFSSRIQYWYLLVIGNITAAYLILLIVSRYESMPPGGGFLKFLRYWYPVIMILFIFKESYLMVHAMNPHDTDRVLIEIDKAMFGVNPTEWLYRFANPLLTEVMMIIYMLYYPVIVIYGADVYLKKRYEDYKFSTFIIFVGFYTSYIFYMIFPAIGPRFHIHDFYSIETELPGIFLTNTLRDILNFGESIPNGVPNPQDYVQRDAMPSAHAEIAILLAYLSHKLKLKSFRFFLPYCILMLVSTVYLRYHYVIDLIAGGVLAIATIGIGKIVYRRRFPLNKGG